MEKTKVLLLEGGKRPSNQTRDELGARGIQAIPVQDLGACITSLACDSDQTVILDLDLQRSGIEAVGKIHRDFPGVAVIVMTSLERLAVADEALRQGAWDFVIKQPDLSHLQELPQAIARCEERKRLKVETERLGTEAQRLRAEVERCQDEITDLKAELEHYRNQAAKFQDEAVRQEEAARLQAECRRLQEEVERLRAALEKGGNGGAKAPAADDEILADIAEDLKSPLAAMIGYLEIAGTISPERVEPNQILSIKRVAALARRLFDLVLNHTGALDIEQGKFELQKSPFQLQQILELAVQDKQGEAGAKDIDLVLEAADDLPILSVDPVQLERALGILISNAIALSPLGGSVAVSSRRESDRVTISVKDSGAGIFQEEIALLFDRKKKLRRRGADISTVGLFVARHIVTMHGGRIDIQSDPVEGTTLTISLPI